MLKRWRIRILLFLAVLGPGFITANVDNDSGGILTYSQAGAQFGYSLLWMMIPITLALIVTQEMCARMGVVTGKGLSDLIREEFGLRLTFVLMVLLVIVNYTNVVTEFIGIAGSLHLFHVSRYISVPICAALVWFLIVRGNYKTTEKVFLVASVVYIAYIFAGVLSQPSWHDALKATVTGEGSSVASSGLVMTGLPTGALPAGQSVLANVPLASRSPLAVSIDTLSLLVVKTQVFSGFPQRRRSVVSAFVGPEAAATVSSSAAAGRRNASIDKFQFK